MKTKKFTLMAALLFAAVAPIYAQNYQASGIKPSNAQIYNLMGGPGIVTSESATQDQLPQAAQNFLQTYYSRVMVGPITHNVVKGQYNVELGNGVKVTFNSAGKVINIVAPTGDSLYAPAIQAVLPAKAYKHLVDAGLLEEVTGIKDATGKGLRVQLLNAMPPEMMFDVDGVFIIIDD